MLFNFPSISLTKIAIDTSGVTPAKITLIALGAERATKIIVKILVKEIKRSYNNQFRL